VHIWGKRAADKGAIAALKAYMAEYIADAPLPSQQRWLGRIQRQVDLPLNVAHVPGVPTRPPRQLDHPQSITETSNRAPALRHSVPSLTLSNARGGATLSTIRLRSAMRTHR
jgi:hypothetical protein